MNKNKLLAVIKENGDTQDTLAEAIGLSRSRLSAKIHERNGAAFTHPEIVSIKNRYNLSDEQLNAIFFN